MAGAHRVSGENEIPGTLKATATLVAAVTVPLGFIAAVAVGIYVLATGSDLTVEGAGVILSVLVFANALVKREDLGTMLALGPALVLLLSSQFVSDVAHQRYWPAGQQHVLAFVSDWVRFLVLAVIVVGFVIRIRSGKIWWPRRSAAQGSGE